MKAGSYLAKEHYISIIYIYKTSLILGKFQLQIIETNSNPPHGTFYDAKGTNLQTKTKGNKVCVFVCVYERQRKRHLTILYSSSSSSSLSMCISERLPLNILFIPFSMRQSLARK